MEKKSIKFTISIIILNLFTVLVSFGQENIFVYKLEEIKEIIIIYKIPEFQHPALIIQKILKRPQSDVHYTNTFNLHQEYVKFSRLNSYALSEEKKKDLKLKQRYSKLISKHFSDYFIFDSTIVCLFSERYDWSEMGGIDLLIFSQTSDKIYLKQIYPESFHSGYYSTPKIVHVNKDTLKVGSLLKDEGSLNGCYKYFVVKEDTILFYRKEVIQGHYYYTPDSNSGNPIKGALTKRYHNTYYKGNQETIRPFYYTSIDENGNQIYGYATGDSLTLYKLGWNHIGEIVKRIMIKNKRLQVGERSYKYGKPFIAIEYDKKWYWIPEDEIQFK